MDDGGDHIKSGTSDVACVESSMLLQYNISDKIHWNMPAWLETLVIGSRKMCGLTRSSDYYEVKIDARLEISKIQVL